MGLGGLLAFLPHQVIGAFVVERYRLKNELAIIQIDHFLAFIIHHHVNNNIIY